MQTHIITLMDKQLGSIYGHYEMSTTQLETFISIMNDNTLIEVKTYQWLFFVNANIKKVYMNQVMIMVEIWVNVLFWNVIVVILTQQN